MELLSQQWFTTSLTAAGMVVLSTAGIYAIVLVLTRITGLRSFSKQSSFDFAVTVAIGSLIAATLAMPEPPLLQAALGMATLFALKVLVAYFRRRAPWVAYLVDNRPLLLMAGPRVLHDNLRRAHVTENDLRAKLREANVLSVEQVRAVVFETTGDISVLHGGEDAPPLDLELFHNVQGAESLEDEERGERVSRALEAP